MRFKTSMNTLLALCVAAVLMRGFAAAPARGQSHVDAPSTQPASTPPAANRASAAQQAAIQPVNEPAADAPMRRWFDKLADADPKVRDQARVDLMGLPADDLPKLRQLVIDQQPIRPAQAAALHDIVIQSFLADEPYQVEGGDTTTFGNQAPYFMGIDWPNQIDSDQRLGVTVDERFPGFPGFRYLHTGDMILGVYMDPTLSLQQLPNSATQTTQQLISTITSRPGIQDIVLQVLRDGEQIRIAIKMAPRPMQAPREAPDAMRGWAALRLDRAETYWQEKFQPLLEAREAAALAE